MLKRKEILFDTFLAGLIFLMVLLMLVLNSCKHETDILPAKKPIVVNNGGGLSTCDPDSIYFENQVLPLLISNCAKSNCHSTTDHKEGIILDNYSAIINTGDVEPGNPGNSKIYEVLFETDPDKRMPPSGQLSQDKIDILNNWISQGAKNNACEDICDTNNVTFSGTVFPMMQSYCIGCHSGATAGGQINLESYSTIVAAANSGKLLGSMSHSAGYQPMPKGGSKLPQCKIDEIRIWIQMGTPN